MAVQLTRLEALRKSNNPDDTLDAAAVAGIESSAVDHQDFLTGVLSQIKRIIHGDDSGNWHDDVDDGAFGGDASLKALFNRATLEGKNILTNRLNLNDVTVSNGQNWQELTGSNKPDKNIAISVSNQGAVTAQLAGAIGSHDLAEIAGSNTLRPKNLVAVFDGASGDPILSSGRRVWGLLQVGSAATDGNPFGDSGNDQGQISFVRATATYDDLEACPVADIEDAAIVYAFSNRDDLADTPEEAFRGDLESADPQAGVAVSLDSAYDGGHYMEVDGNDVDIRLADTKSWVVRNGAGGTIIFQLTRNDTTGDELELNLDSLDVNVPSGGVSFSQGIIVDDDDQDLNLGVNAAGTIDSTGITVEATAGDALVKASADVEFQTVRETSPFPLDDATAGAISALFGQTFASVSAAIKYAGEHGGVDLTLKKFVAGSNYGQDVNIPAAIQDITTYPIDMENISTVKQLVYLNGRLLVGGNVTTQNDVYVGDTPANGDIKVDFPKGIKTGDVIISVVLAE